MGGQSPVFQSSTQFGGKRHVAVARILPYFPLSSVRSSSFRHMPNIFPSQLIFNHGNHIFSECGSPRLIMPSQVQPSKSQYCPVQPNTAQCCPFQPSTASSSPVQPSKTQYSLTKYSPVQYSTAHYSPLQPTTAQYSPV